MEEFVITQEFLKEIFTYKDGCFYWKVVLSRHGKIGKLVGCDNGKGYLKVGINKKYYAIHRLMFLYHYGYLPKLVDHKDRNPLNNHPKNLREATDQQNALNRGVRSNNKSQYKGVSFHKQTNKWHARITIYGMRTHLGYFETPELASEAYKQAQEKYHTHRPH